MFQVQDHFPKNEERRAQNPALQKSPEQGPVGRRRDKEKAKQ